MVLALLVGIPSGGQPTGDSPPAAPPARKKLTLDDLPPSVRLGVRVERVRRGMTVAPTVVVVGDGRSYAEAIALWSPRLRFPVLIDDGTPAARDGIARFVRAFKPQSVIRWSAPEAEAWPVDPESRPGAIVDSVARAWDLDGVGTMADLVKGWLGLGLTPPGIVAADPSHPCWTAALALAAGRGEPIAWVGVKAGQSLDSNRSDALAVQIEAACKATGLSWMDLGDQIDAVTLCLNVGSRMRGQTPLALTDRIGRHRAGAAGRARRWAWAGQVFGNESMAAYRAMSALFLMPGKAWLFDGYPARPPFSAWDATPAKATLEGAGLATTLFDSPNQSAAVWRMTTARPLGAGLVMVNTKGNSTWFELEPGRCLGGDVPTLDVPAMVHFVHSFSASSVTNRCTIAGRWLERGAYAYIGAVDEPFLQAFVPTPIVARRLVSSVPWGAAGRIGGDRVWKIAVVGDPLITLGPPAPRAEDPMTIDGATGMDALMREAVRGGRYAEAVDLLVMLGRDDKAARLASGVLRERPGRFGADLARGSIAPLYRTGMVEDLVRAYQRLPKALGKSGSMRDLLWQACLPHLSSTSDPRLVLTLADNIRPEQLVWDAARVRGAMARVFGSAKADAWLDGLVRTQTDPKSAQGLRQLLIAPRGK